jgi:Winged helix DNA-binding domain
VTQQWLERQLLPSRPGISIADVVTNAGWIPSAGGTGPYLAIRARIPGITRQDIDDAVFERMEIIELPSVRDTAFLVPRADAGIALAAGRRAYDERLRKLPIDRAELSSLGTQILETLGEDARTTDQLRHDLPPGSIRDLGDAGKRLGITSTLTATLKLLHAEGKILRTNTERRLDGRTHLYRRWPAEIDTNPPPDLDIALAQRFLSWSAPADVDDFAWWSGLGKRAAKTAMTSLRVDDVPILPRRSDDAITLLPFRDNLFGLHRGLAPFVDDDSAEVMDTSGRAIAAKDAEMLHHNAILVNGMLHGIWEFDGEWIVWKCFGNPPRGLDTAIGEMETFIREQLGDHKYYAFDSGGTRAKRVGFVRR